MGDGNILPMEMPCKEVLFLNRDQRGSLVNPGDLDKFKFQIQGNLVPIYCI